MTRLEIVSVDYARYGGMAVISGNNAKEIVEALEKNEGIDCAEYDTISDEYCMCYNKVHWTTEGFRDLYKSYKAQLKK